ncbi:helix-turn-helix domain-containing protein [Pseudoflavonifractor sp. 524-17]|uniref:helix-turn-helix domain-containing protein n=1 Tax=Pseudoflavonifractor sp. 524-17 TaxID=2304577 RepID=UPI00137B6AED|nr:XRE family transcriptional regulator [Pseudoflavonifractor sp. 524-17]NCE63994.1 helix-turn-helix domain-containing protein [Pseudoflavonifractor sp. 524-17]
MQHDQQIPKLPPSPPDAHCKASGSPSVDTSHLNVRRLRRLKGMTLRQLASQSGLSLSYLSNYENGKVNITISSLKKIAEAIGAPVADLLTDSLEHDVTIVSKEDRYSRVLYECAAGAAIQEYLMYSNRAAMHVSITHLPPHSDSGAPSSHYGEEFILTLKGVVTVILDDYSYQLPEGSMIYYRSTFFHKVANEQDTEASFFQVNTPPTY